MLFEWRQLADYVHVILILGYSLTAWTPEEFEEGGFSPMRCQEKCKDSANCGSWALVNHTCTLSELIQSPPLYFNKKHGTGGIVGGKKTTEDVKQDALQAFCKSFDLLSASIPNETSCQFIELKEELPTITEYSNKSVENIQLVDSFLRLNDETLEELYSIQSEKIDHMNTKVNEIEHEVEKSSKEVSYQTERLLNIKQEIQSNKKKEDNLIQQMNVVKTREIIGRKKVEASERKLEEKTEKLKWSLIRKQRLESAKNAAENQYDIQEERYENDKASYEYHRDQHEKKTNGGSWYKWAIPGYNIIHAIDTIHQYETDYKRSKSAKSRATRRYLAALENFNNAAKDFQSAQNDKDRVSLELQDAELELNSSQIKFRKIETEKNITISKLKILNESAKEHNYAISKTEYKIRKCKLLQDFLRNQIKNNEYEVAKLEIGKQQIKDEMKKVGRMKKNVAFVHVLLDSMNTGLRYSQRKRESNMAPTWTLEEFEEAVEEVFIGIEDSLSVLISDQILLEQLGLRVTVSAKKMKEVIKTCELKFGGSFYL